MTLTNIFLQTDRANVNPSDYNNQYIFIDKLIKEKMKEMDNKHKEHINQIKNTLKQIVEAL